MRFCLSAVPIKSGWKAGRLAFQLGINNPINKRGLIMKTKIFWIFGILQSLSLGIIVFLLFRSLNLIKGENVIGLDTQILLSIFFPLFLLLVEYIIYQKK
ncbi:hypothetical protein DRP43_05850 [candidate division TA06 bacterium]|uniref:Uncharacterized protein n=1 Tax=candidate division TA06 bacterium TaxID=2250710 RepID=A0A660SCB5_UNCT6|nr:MAG: hypothetical protein DRP43_05850 [candidate division TA06 bacterium]